MDTEPFFVGWGGLALINAALANIDGRVENTSLASLLPWTANEAAAGIDAGG